jgi:hypothetical protein
MDKAVRSRSKRPTIDRRLWRIDRGNRELVAERHRTPNGRFRTVWLVPEETLHGILWVEVVEEAQADPSP